MKKWLIALALLALVMVLLPMQGAKADHYEGEKCPGCGKGQLILYINSTNNTSGFHFFVCTNADCKYYHAAQNVVILTEKHYGGEATCKSGPICKGCGMEYGAPKHDWGASVLMEDGTHKRTCKRGCGTSETHAASWGDWSKVDDENHRHTCQVNGCNLSETAAHDWDQWEDVVIREEHEHVCKDCGAEVAQKCSFTDFEYYNNKYHACVCTVCYHPKMEAHSGGEATCVSQAVCEICQKPYGKLDDENHPAQSVTPATCVDRAYCAACRNSFGTTDPGSHDMVLNTERGQNGDGWDFFQDQGIMYCKAYFKCQRSGCNEETFTESQAAQGPKTYNKKTGKVSCTYSKTVSPEVGREYTGTYTVESDPIPVDCVYSAAGVYYLNVPQAVPESWNCHYEPGEWTGALPFRQVVESGGEFYLAANVDILKYTLNSDMIEKVEGTATCTQGGDEAYWKCPVCGKMYSEEACGNEIFAVPAAGPLGHDFATTLTQGDDTHYYGCSRCTVRKDEAAHVYENWTYVNDGSHEGACVCGKKKTEAHSGGTAYCNAKAVCEVCKQEYGEVDLDNHAPGKFHPATCERAAYCEVEDRIFDEGRKDPNNHVGLIVDVQGKAATCTETGLTDGKQCQACQAFTVEQQEIPALGHNFYVSRRTITRITYTCGRCGGTAGEFNPGSQNRLPGLVRDESGADASYTAGVSRIDGKWVLTVTPDPVDEGEGDSSLYLTPADVEQWLKERISEVRFQRDGAALVIDLKAITADWFTLEEGAEIECCVFTLTVKEDGLLVRVEAMVGEERIPADGFTGIALLLGDNELPVTENGVYAAI